MPIAGKPPNSEWAFEFWSLPRLLKRAGFVYECECVNDRSGQNAIVTAIISKTDYFFSERKPLMNSGWFLSFHSRNEGADIAVSRPKIPRNGHGFRYQVPRMNLRVHALSPRESFRYCMCKSSSLPLLFRVAGWDHVIDSLFVATTESSLVWAGRI